jgi:RNA polymerase sigma-70 factor (ECF subfamily)
MDPILTSHYVRPDELTITERFLEYPDDASFAQLFDCYTPQLRSFFRGRGCEPGVAEDLAQDVMLTVHLKFRQIRDRALFRTWLFKVARNAMCRHYGRLSRQAETVDLDSVVNRVAATGLTGATSVGFQQLMSLLEEREREVMTLRFLEQWEYHEIAAAQSIPIGTVQWRVFNAKKKLASRFRNPAPCRRSAEVLRRPAHS